VFVDLRAERILSCPIILGLEVVLMRGEPTMSTQTERKDVYTRVTERIIFDLEQGVRTWLKPWHAEHAAGRITKPLRHNGTPYRGMNMLLLWGEAMDKGYTTPIWMTCKQAQETGGQVRKGEHGSLVVYANSITKTETNEKGEDTEHEIPFMKGYTVFNVEQVDGLPARDAIQLPPFEAFRDKESYYATALHELTHWTKHERRLDRDFSAKRFDDHGYAREELVAELGAAFLCAELGITPEVREDHAAYLEHWLTVLKEDKRAMFSTAAHAQHAADYLSGLQQKQESAAA
jgi:antirestriction protein ArdC